MNDPQVAMFWEPTTEGAVNCALCPQACHIPKSKMGFCGIRENRDSQLVAANYGYISSIALDPIEKKPLYRFHPGKRVLSIGGFGCNLRCPFCQNCEISLENNHQRVVQKFSPKDIVNLAVQTVPEGNIGIAYTYNEPLIGFEFVYDCAKETHNVGLLNVIVTNGYIKQEPLKKLLPLVDGMNIDLKGFTDIFYKKIGGTLEAVKETIINAYRHCHLEITTLVIPEENENDIEPLAIWLATLDSEIPLHLTRFFPRYKYADKRPTPLETIYKYREVAQKHLKYVYAGNIDN